MSTQHVIDRLASRLSDSDRATCIARMYQLEDSVLGKGSCACVLGHNTSNYKAGSSEGRVIIGVWRGKWVTVMLRRSNQAVTPQAFGVDRVIA